MSINCLEGPFPDDICHAQNIRSIVLNGVFLSEQCKHPLWSPFHGAPVAVNVIEGTVPSCLWQMTSVQNLYMAGNIMSQSLSEIEVSQNSSLCLRHEILFSFFQFKQKIEKQFFV